MNRLLTSLSLTIFALLANVVGAAPATATFINGYAHKTLYLATATFHAGESSADAGPYSLPAESPSQWSYEGWKVIKPGEVYVGPAGSYYVMEDDRHTMWPGLTASEGPIPFHNQAFKIYISAESRGQEIQRRSQSGEFQRATYQFFQGRYFYGADYHVERRQISFDHRSRSLHLFGERFFVPGNVAYVENIKVASQGVASVSWSQEGNFARLSGVLQEGEQGRPFGPRAQNFYSGTADVFYLVR